MLHRTKVVEFISLLRRLRLSNDEMRLADNYFTLLSNTVPEIWFDQDFELGGADPFTVGSVGAERNINHTVGLVFGSQLVLVD